MIANLKIIATGGTFDKVYLPLSGELGFVGSHLAQIMAGLNCEVDWEEAMQLDSLEMSETHRWLLHDRILKSGVNRIVIVHGTDTMPETARFLAEHCPRHTIVLTGAMRPWSFGKSDAEFNLGGALIAAQTLAEGTWICIHGRVHPAATVYKDRSRGIFESSPE